MDFNTTGTDYSTKTVSRCASVGIQGTTKSSHFVTRYTVCITVHPSINHPYEMLTEQADKAWSVTNNHSSHLARNPDNCNSASTCLRGLSNQPALTSSHQRALHNTCLLPHWDPTIAVPAAYDATRLEVVEAGQSYREAAGTA